MPATDTIKKLVPASIAAGLGALLGAVVATNLVEPAECPECPGVEPQARCVNQTYTCTAYTPPGSIYAPDAGHPPYVPLIMAGQKCPVGDGGVTIPVIPTPSPEVIVDPAFCVETIGPDAGAHIEPSEVPIGLDALGIDAFGCACRVGQDCRVKLADGGTALAPFGETLPFKGSVGTQCFGKVCVEVAGITSWPSECPTRRPPFDGGVPLPDGGFADDF